MIIKDNTSTFKLLNYFGIKTNSIRLLKNKLREKIDKTNHSVIHATDNSTQAIEYINLILGKTNIKNFDTDQKIQLLDMLKGLIIMPKYLFYQLKKIQNIFSKFIKTILKLNMKKLFFMSLIFQHVIKMYFFTYSATNLLI